MGVGRDLGCFMNHLAHPSLSFLLCTMGIMIGTPGDLVMQGRGWMCECLLCWAVQAVIPLSICSYASSALAWRLVRGRLGSLD